MYKFDGKTDEKVHQKVNTIKQNTFKVYFNTTFLTTIYFHPFFGERSAQTLTFCFDSSIMLTMAYANLLGL